MLTFKKTERLCRKKLISELYTKGNQLFYYPFKVLWLVSDLITGEKNAQILICVSKKNVSSAFKRNKIKRQIKEAYRRNKYNYFEYLKNSSKQNLLVFHYLEKKIISYQEIEAKIILILHRLQLENEKTNR